VKDNLCYKGFMGSIEISIEDDCLHGKLLFTNDLVTYEARTPNQLQAEFESAVEDYLATCKEIGRSPEKPL
jgi:predicted HicB family RNase H-like nuclease